MTTNTHGGARPKVREDDGRKGNSGPGRKPQSVRLKLGDQRAAFFTDSEGKAIRPGELWTIKDISSQWITISLEDGSTITISR